VLRVTIERVAKQGRRAEVLQHAIIDDKGDGCYTATFYRKHGGGIYKQVTIDGFKRKRFNLWQLLRALLNGE
jgi:hypothetical protein